MINIMLHMVYYSLMYYIVLQNHFNIYAILRKSFPQYLGNLYSNMEISTLVQALTHTIKYKKASILEAIFCKQ